MSIEVIDDEAVSEIGYARFRSIFDFLTKDIEEDCQETFDMGQDIVIFNRYEDGSGRRLVIDKEELAAALADEVFDVKKSPRAEFTDLGSDDVEHFAAYAANAMLSFVSEENKAEAIQFILSRLQPAVAEQVLNLKKEV